MIWNALTKAAVGLLLGALPLIVWPHAGDMYAQFDLPKLLAVFLLGNLCFAASITRVAWPIALLHAAIAVSVVATGNGSHFYLYWMGALLFSLWFLEEYDGVRDFGWNAIIAGGWLVAVHCYVQMIWTDPFLTYAQGIEQHLPIAFLGQHTKMGAYLAPVAACALARGSWKSYLFMLPVCLATGSSFTWASLGIGSLIALKKGVYGDLTAFLLTMAGTGALLSLYLLYPNHEVFYGHGRKEVWAAAVSAWRHSPRPFWGFGPGSFQVLFPGHYLAPGTWVGIQPEQTASHGAFLQAHNDYVQALFEFGLFGALALATALLAVLKHFWNHWLFLGDKDVPKEIRGCQAMLAAFLVNAVGNFPLQLAPHHLLATLSFSTLMKYSFERVKL